MNDRDADFTEYATRRWPALLRAGVLLGCSEPDAEDLAQAALVKTWQHWAKVRKTAEPDAYVYRILVNTLATQRRRKWRGEQPTGIFPDDRREDHQDDRSSEVALRGAVTTALRRLPVDQQQVLVLRYVADLSERATAEALGIAVGTVKSRTSRALAALDPSHFADFAGDDT
jgi:RNA polymerase sigma-70 factor (sigma-E family)